jgi:hypothetical protein
MGNRRRARLLSALDVALVHKTESMETAKFAYNVRRILLCLMFSTPLLGCGKADPEKTKHALTWLKQHYEVERFAVRKGAEFAAFRVEADGNRLQVVVVIPSPSGANTLRNMETPQRHRYWERLACPSWEAPFWGIKDPKHSLVLELRGPTTFDRDYIIHATCRQEGN